MAKRSDGAFERRKNDDYPTFDPRAVAALRPHLAPATRFVEPCAGGGVLVDQLTALGHILVYACDIQPRRHDISLGDAFTCDWHGADHDCFITNPPWTRELLHPLIVHLSDQAPTWLLFDADWAHTKQARSFRDRLRRIVSVGRLRWIPGTKMDGKDNCAGYLFDRPRAAAAASFFLRSSEAVAA